MSLIVILRTNKPAKIIRSANTPDYLASSSVLINPDLSRVSRVNRLYWKNNSGDLAPMNATEKSAVDDAIKQQRIGEIDNYQFDGGVLAESLVDAGIITKQTITGFIKTKEGLV